MSATNRWYKACFSALFSLLLIGGAGISDANAKGKASAVAKGGVKALTKFQHTYGDLGGEWWVWAFDTGFGAFGDGDVDCRLGQSGEVQYLAGTFSGFSERNCTIKRGKSLFFPLVNTLLFYDPTFPDPPEFDLTIEEKRIFLDGRIGGGSLADDPKVAELAALGYVSEQACNLHATLDGELLVATTPLVRAQSGPVTITVDEEAIADGIWVLHKPLKKGTHVLEFGGATCNTEDGTVGFETSVKYNLTVK